jgi:hypothetical protein
MARLQKARTGEEPEVPSYAIPGEEGPPPPPPALSSSSSERVVLFLVLYASNP